MPALQFVDAGVLRIGYVDAGPKNGPPVADRRALCRLLWRTWSPTCAFDDATFDRSAAAFDNPDFVDVVIQSYRHRFGLAAGDHALVPGVGHNMPQEVPAVFADAVLRLVRGEVR